MGRLREREVGRSHLGRRTRGGGGLSEIAGEGGGGCRKRIEFVHRRIRRCWGSLLRGRQGPTEGGKKRGGGGGRGGGGSSGGNIQEIARYGKSRLQEGIDIYCQYPIWRCMRSAGRGERGRGAKTICEKKEEAGRTGAAAGGV